jgi:hypothetical protein
MVSSNIKYLFSKSLDIVNNEKIYIKKEVLRGPGRVVSIL